MLQSLPQTWPCTAAAHVSYRPPVPDPEPEIVQRPNVVWRLLSWLWRSKSKAEEGMNRE